MLGDRQESRVAWTQDISRLEGGLLTVIDAAFADPIQRKATKDLVRRHLWDWFQMELTQIEGEGMDSSVFKVMESVKLGRAILASK